MNSAFPSYSFKLEYFDERSDLIRPYVMQFHTQKGEIELYDLKQKKVFLKKTSNHNVQLKDLFIGNKIFVNGRQYDVMDFSDNFTRSVFVKTLQHTCAIIKPGFVQRLGETIDRIYQNGLVVSKLRCGNISNENASKFFESQAGGQNFPSIINYITRGPIVAMELVGNNAIELWKRIVGPESPDIAKREAPNSLRALYSNNDIENFAHASDTPQDSSRELGIIFGNNIVKLVSEKKDSTLCLIKPHAIKEGIAGKIIQSIVEEGFRIGGAVMTTLEAGIASEFLEVYKGVVEEYPDFVSELASGSVIALNLVKNQAVSTFRELCGPRDVMVAKQIRPTTLRAVFGTDIIHNAVHCTDLEDDARGEVEYFFDLLEQ